jgi:hypothetical protein
MEGQGSERLWSKWGGGGENYSWRRGDEDGDGWSKLIKGGEEEYEEDG